MSRNAIQVQLKHILGKYILGKPLIKFLLSEFPQFTISYHKIKVSVVLPPINKNHIPCLNATNLLKNAIYKIKKMTPGKKS